jgi:hypothetical protein
MKSHEYSFEETTQPSGHGTADWTKKIETAAGRHNDATSQAPASPISCMTAIPTNSMHFCQSGSPSSVCRTLAWRWSGRSTAGRWVACRFPPIGSRPDFSPRASLALATFIAATGYLIVALPLGFVGLCIGLVLAGIGSSVQHPRASMLVTTSYGKAVRGPLSIYSFAGDLGKVTFPAAVALMLPFAAWRPVVGLTAAIGLVVAFVLLFLLPQQSFVAAVEEEAEDEGQDGRGFNLLLAIGVFDTATRMGYLLFLPFLVEGKGGSGATLGAPSG